MAPRSTTKKHSASNPFFGFLGATKDAKTASALQGHLVAMSGEFVGTFMFLFLAYCGHTMSVEQATRNGTDPNSTNSASTMIYISLSYGFALLVTVWTMYRISGGLFNPAVTLGLMVTGNIPATRGLLLLPVQITSSIAAAGVVSAFVPGDIRTVQTTLTPSISVAQGLFLEMFLTAFFLLNILMLAAEKSKDTFIAPVGIGLTLFGPFLGTLVASGYYHFVKFFNYDDANPGQDSSGGDFGGE
ncbi:hypothetical protein B0A55_10363 [Friedmanniomyces simplex]|uniref:Aquaporin n=1 Tax=Friedmanniomyces simplex TaxID=329884 RepID=A0A4U0X952_9PEZI|nr:hypothetical protein B0A55_10363 [Friedmanniomyces simplex]